MIAVCSDGTAVACRHGFAMSRLTATLHVSYLLPGYLSVCFGQRLSRTLCGGEAEWVKQAQNM